MGLIKVQDLADYLNVSRSTIYNLIHRGMPSIPIGASRRFRVADVEQWIDEHAEEWAGVLRRETPTEGEPLTFTMYFDFSTDAEIQAEPWKDLTKFRIRHGKGTLTIVVTPEQADDLAEKLRAISR